MKDKSVPQAAYGMEDEKDRQAREAYYREIIRNYTMMHDIFARNVLKDIDCAEYVIQVILDREDLKVKSVAVQSDYKNLQGKSSCLDCVAEDAEHNQYDIEIEQAGAGFPPKRARYYTGLLDMNTLKEGEDYERLRASFLIIIAEHDPRHPDLPIYHVDRIVRETGIEFEDDSHIIYVNAGAQHNVNTRLGRLMHDFHCTRAEDMYSGVLKKKVNALKNTPEGVSDMSDIVREIMEYGELQKARQTALRMYHQGHSIPVIAAALDVSEEQVKTWLNESAVPA